jgi:hypothetical protein
MQIIQCLSCGRVKQEDNQWVYREISPFEKNISHTYCRQCIHTLQEKLIAARDFKKWDFDKQICYLSQELDRHQKKHDQLSFKNYMEEFFCIPETDYPKYFEALKEKLVFSVCAKCGDEINHSDITSRLGTHILHARCYKELAHKIQIIQDNGWEKSDKMDAYFDLLRIEKEIRPVIKEVLKNRDNETRTVTENR